MVSRLRISSFLALTSCLLLQLPPIATGLKAKWTAADEDGAEQMPMSKRYRDKLDELEAKVGPEKFKEMTGMPPPSQTKSGRAAKGGGGGGGGVGDIVVALKKLGSALASGDAAAAVQKLAAVLTSIVPGSNSNGKVGKAVSVAVVVTTAVVGYKLWEHRERTGFKVPFVAGHASLLPPPRRHIETWLRTCGEESSASVSSSEDGVSPTMKGSGSGSGSGKQRTRRILLGRGEGCFRAAQNALHALRMCEGDEAVELSNLDFVGLQQQQQLPRRRDGATKLAALLVPHGRLWWLLPFQVTKESRGESVATGDGGSVSSVRDSIELATIDRFAPWCGGMSCTLEWKGDSNEGGGGGGGGRKKKGSSTASSSERGGVYFTISMHCAAAPATDGKGGVALMDGHADVLLDAMGAGMDRVVAKEMAARAARLSTYDTGHGGSSGSDNDNGSGSYQSAADKALREKRRRERSLKLRRSDVLANYRFRGGFRGGWSAGAGAGAGAAAPRGWWP